jgi:hypothetical protein
MPSVKTAAQFILMRSQRGSKSLRKIEAASVRGLVADASSIVTPRVLI